MESRDDRLRRFEDNPPTEIISTLINSINNFFNPEIAKAAEDGCWSLVIMGVHSVTLTISFGLFGDDTEKGYVRFLQTFMDSGESGGDYSAIGSKIHDWRNVLAHQWLAAVGHTFGLDPGMDVGWERRGDTTVLNPKRYHEAYRHAFRTSSDLWRPDRILTAEEMEANKRRLIKKYVNR